MKHFFLPGLCLILLLGGCITKTTETGGDTPASGIVAAIDSLDRNNNFYDNAETYLLPGGDIVVEGEIENPGRVDLSKLTKRMVIAKEAVLADSGRNSFVGAYTYQGYSLFDILNDRVLDKKNKEAFRPIIDLYVIVMNDKGERVVLSWGEIYYPNHLHEVLIATEVSRIVPSKTKDLWPLPQERKLVVGHDLVSERNISNPTRIIVKSWETDIPANKGQEPLFSEKLRISGAGVSTVELTKTPEGLQTETLHTIFYGKGRGIHSTQPFHGVYLKEVLKPLVPFDRETLREKMVAAVGADGYRSVFSLSEILNRSDQEEILLVPASRDEGGIFRIFPACDFFSDRAVKALSELVIFELE
jgi:hypothetical protein